MGGGHGPRAQALEGAPAQLVGVNFKSRAFKGPALPMHLFMHPRAKGFVFTKGGGRKGGGASRVGLCGRRGMPALAPGRWRPSVRHCRADTVAVRKVDGALLGGGESSRVWALATRGSYDRVVLMGGGRHEVIPPVRPLAHCYCRSLALAMALSLTVSLCFHPLVETSRVNMRRCSEYHVT